MNNLIKLHLLAAWLLCAVVAEAYGAPIAPSVFVDRSEVIYPVPEDSDVIYTFGQASKNALPATNIKFLVWNVHKGMDKGFELEFISLAYGSHVIMNQEIFLDNNMRSTFSYMPHFYFTTATSFFSGKEKTRTGLANITKVDPVFTDFVRTQTQEPIANSPKVTLINSYPIVGTGQNLTVVNIHGINFVTNQSFKKELNRIFEKIKNIPPPLVFAGDFNTWNAERMRILDEYTKKLNLSEASFTPDHRMTFNDYPLDHFFHTRDLLVTRASVDEFYQGSDHKPLVVEVDYLPQDH